MTIWTGNSAVVPDAPKARAGTHGAACADRWVPGLATLARDDNGSGMP
jgi:hypothetical protein